MGQPCPLALPGPAQALGALPGPPRALGALPGPGQALGALPGPPRALNALPGPPQALGAPGSSCFPQHRAPFSKNQSRATQTGFSGLQGRYMVQLI